MLPVAQLIQILCCKQLQALVDAPTEAGGRACSVTVACIFFRSREL